MIAASTSVPQFESPAAALVGLTTQQAQDLQSEYGPNDPKPNVRGALAFELLRLFLNPLVIILLIASLISGFLGQKVDAEIIFSIVLLSVTIDFLQTYRSHRAIEKLREHVSLTATVLRDGQWQEIKRQDIVPGDIIRLSAGDLVPADGHLLQARDLYVQQGALTGESMPAEKEVRPDEKSTAITPLAIDRVFLGTSIVSGTGVARMEATGTRTAFGAIAAKLADRPEQTEFEHGLRRFGMLITRTVFFLVLFILVVRVATHKNPFESFVFAVALAVGLTPEFLPMITSVTLGRAAMRMARHKVIVKHLPAIQNFGTIDVFCSDKTGTLTTGKMILSSSVDSSGSPSDRPLSLGYINSKFETGIRNPLEEAILHCAGQNAEAYLKVDEIPFDFDRRRLSVVVKQIGEDHSGLMLITKGAPEGVLEISDFYEVDGHIEPLDSLVRNRCRQIFLDLSGQGYRVLAVAYRQIDVPGRFSAGDEHSLVFAGYLAFADPPSADAAASLAGMKRDGVDVKILTGDNELVARHVCDQVGIKDPVILIGDDLESTSDAALDHLAEETTVFARVTPMQKHRIIHALKRRGHVVGYMGDGINDAPSLHAADVGISVAAAVDVARDAADIILVEPGLKILHDGIIEGRRASANVLKYLFMGTSSNFGNMFSMAGASLFLPFLPMLPTQILLNNFLYDASQLTIPSDNVDERYIRAPRRWDMGMVRNFMIFIGPISSIYDFLTFYVLLHFFHASEPEFHTGWFVESLATQILVIFVIRTMGNPLRSRPSVPLGITTLLLVVAGILLPYSPLAHVFGFVPLPGPFFVFLAASTATYLLLVELGKRLLRTTSDGITARCDSAHFRTRPVRGY